MSRPPHLELIAYGPLYNTSSHQQELFGAKEDRLEYLEEKRLGLLEALQEDAQQELGSAMDLESVRIHEWVRK